MTTWSTALVPERRRFEVWADVVCRAFVPLECDAPARAGFEASIRRRTLGTVALAEVTADAQRVRRTAPLLARHPSDALIVALHLAGHGGVEQGERGHRLVPGRAAATDAGRPYAFAFAGRFRQIVIRVPGEAVAPATRAALADGAASIDLSAGAGRLLALAARLAVEDAADDAEAAGIGEAIASLAAAALAAAPPALPPVDRRWRAAVDEIECRLADPALDRAAVAAAAGVSVRTLARLFAARGETVDGFIRARRLDAAHAALAAGDRRPVGELAFAHGFADPAHFARRFAERFGIPPSACRR